MKKSEKAARAFPEMRDLKLLQRLVAALATNEGVQSKRTEILQRLKSLSSREVDVLCYVLGGQLNREIAAELGVSERTIKTHRGRVTKKLGVRSTAQLFPNGVACAMRERMQGILQTTAPNSPTESENHLDYKATFETQPPHKTESGNRFWVEGQDG